MRDRLPGHLLGQLLEPPALPDADALGLEPDGAVVGASPSPGVPQPVKIRMSQNEVALGVTYRW